MKNYLLAFLMALIAAVFGQTEEESADVMSSVVPEEGGNSKLIIVRVVIVLAAFVVGFGSVTLITWICKKRKGYRAIGN